MERLGKRGIDNRGGFRDRGWAWGGKRDIDGNGVGYTEERSGRVEQESDQGSGRTASEKPERPPLWDLKRWEREAAMGRCMG